MNAEKLNETYVKKKDVFYQYINSIKSRAIVDVHTIINATLIKNPYLSEFPKKFFLEDFKKKIIIYQFIKSALIFYIRQTYFLVSYFIAFLLFKIYYKKDKVTIKNHIAIDVFFVIDNIIEDNKFNENYFRGLYDVLEKYNQEYVYLPRLYGISKNPFKLIKFFKIINEDSRDFIFEFELLSCKDYFLIIYIILTYPFKTLRLLQTEKSNEDTLFNNELIKDIGSVSFDAISRYLFGKNIAHLGCINRIYSWNEFQVLERSFNYGIRSENKDILLIGCQFYLNYETYFSSYLDYVDIMQNTFYNAVLVNGKYYLKDESEILYKNGVSLRYKDIFSKKIIMAGKKIVLLGSYLEHDTIYMLQSAGGFDEVLFKNHPAVKINNIKSEINTNVKLTDDNIYKLFEDASIVVCTGFSGVSLEAVAFGTSVIIIASQDNITTNPLVDYGKGKIWDIAFSKDDVKKLYNNLIEYRKNNIEEIQKIAVWYKDNFFIEPTEDNIIQAFELDIDKD